MSQPPTPYARQYNFNGFTFATPQTPADLGPLVRVELLTNDNP